MAVTKMPIRRQRQRKLVRVRAPGAPAGSPVEQAGHFAGILQYGRAHDILEWINAISGDCHWRIAGRSSDLCSAKRPQSAEIVNDGNSRRDPFTGAIV
jgi:hypothetical protein